MKLDLFALICIECYLFCVHVVYGDTSYDIRPVKVSSSDDISVNETKYVSKFLYNIGVDSKMLSRSYLPHHRNIIFDEINILLRNKRAPCGERIRKEVRQMSSKEWDDYVLAVQKLKEKGIYNEMANIHSGNETILKAHGGANFLGWHRIYLLLYEIYLRREKPCVTLPYWDPSLDYPMKDPKKSILWSSKYFGNGDQMVTTGPFANWKIIDGVYVFRDIGKQPQSALISKNDMKRILSKSNHAQITDYFNDRINCLERYHNLVHRWVGGHMMYAHFAAHDPVFFMYHCFIDYWWELFRKEIQRKHGTNSYYDYPNDKRHPAETKMDPFSKFTNRQGYHNFWANLYSYQLSPTCNSSFTSCGSEDLMCDSTFQCVSKEYKRKFFTWKPSRFGWSAGPLASIPKQAKPQTTNEFKLSSRFNDTFASLESDNPPTGGVRPRIVESTTRKSSNSASKTIVKDLNFNIA